MPTGAMEAKQYSPLTLAYLGDAVYELLIRTAVVVAGNAPVNKLNRRASNLSKAAAQSEMAGRLMEYFTEEELAMYKRGRNAHSYTKAKNATVGDYRRATGLEAVFGFLYLEGKMDRILALINTGLASSGCPDEKVLL
ncbi:MAG TPA: ribonuclease III [Lachnospiraceae bacterium]|nr:ribonuclease III [Lachnospiraceae bacterium]